MRPRIVLEEATLPIDGGRHQSVIQLPILASTIGGSRWGGAARGLRPWRPYTKTLST
jgi:hypothetical protein